MTGTAADSPQARLERRVDLGQRALDRKRDARTGALHVRAPLTWIGVREYRRADGSVSRELRRPEQVRSASHMAALRRLVASPDHPTDVWEGRRLPVTLWTGAREDSPPGADGTLRRPPARYQVGHTGDAIELVEVDGEQLPVAWITVTDEAAIRAIEAGAEETSLGYGALIVDAPPGSTWTDARGRELPYDREHVLDVEDPRVKAAAEAGMIDPEELGPNHFAVAIHRGRGGRMSRLLDSAGGAGVGEFVTRADVLGLLAEATQAGCCWWRAPALVGPHPAQWAPIQRIPNDPARYPSWYGTSEGGEDGASWIAFWEMDWSVRDPAKDPQPGLGYLWTARDPEGGVLGDPVMITRAPAPTSAGGERQDAIPLRTDLVEPRLFAMVRQADESGTSGTGRVMDGVVWGDGTVATRWRSEAAAHGAYDSWTTFHRVHGCSHPTNGTLYQFADGGEVPRCDACAAAPETSDDASSERVSDATLYPHGVLTKMISLKAKRLADALAKLPGATLTPKADAVECSIPDQIPGAALAEFLASLSGGEAAMVDEAAAAQQALGQAEANLSAMSGKVDALKPYELAGKQAARDVAVTEAREIVGDKCEAIEALARPKVRATADGKNAEAASDLEPATAAQVRRAAVVAKLGDSYKDASEDRVVGAYVALLATARAGGKVKPTNDADPDQIPNKPVITPSRDRSQDPDRSAKPELLDMAKLG